MKLIKEAVKEHSRKLNLSLEARDNICREDFEQLEKMLSDKIFTDRELVYKRKYEK